MDIVKKYIILNTSEVSKINFDEVLETSANTLRTSLDGSKTFVKYSSNDIPASLNQLNSKEGPYNYEEISAILNTSDWLLPNVSGSIN